MNYENVNKIFSTQINVAEIKHSNFIHKLQNQQIVSLNYWAIVVSTLESLISTFSAATLQKVTSSFSMSVTPIFTFCSWITGSSTMPPSSGSDNLVNIGIIRSNTSGTASGTIKKTRVRTSSSFHWRSCDLTLSESDH